MASAFRSTLNDKEFIEERPALSRRESALLVAALMVGLSLAALDSTVVGTALPTIVADLGGLELYSWLVAAYLLTSTTTVPVYGRMADMWGRKPVFLAGVALFLTGSVLCGMAHSMVQLVLFRAVQGLGAGAVQPMVMTIVGDAFGVEQRARMQGLFGGVWGVSSVVGPPVGAALLTLASWPWIFYLNLPLGLVALLMVSRVYHERVVSHQRSLHWLSALALTVALSLLLLVLQAEGAWQLAFGTAAALGFGMFWLLERGTDDPMIPLSLLRRPLISVSYLITVLAGLVVFSVTAFLPLFVQGVMGGTPLAVGAVLAPMSVGWFLGGMVSGRLILLFSYKKVLVGGVIAAFAGAAGLVLMAAGTSQVLLMAVVGIIGIGMGLLTAPSIIALQDAVQWQQRGVATALMQFCRTIGGSVGVAVSGALVNWRLQAALGGGVAGRDTAGLVRDLLDPAIRAGYSGAELAAVREALSGAVQSAFLLVLLAAGIMTVLGIAAFPAGLHATSRPAPGSGSESP